MDKEEIEELEEKKESNNQKKAILMLEGVIVLLLVVIIALLVVPEIIKSESTVKESNTQEEKVSSNKTTENGSNNDKVHDEKLDINSLLVASLYNRVKSQQDGCLSAWIFGDSEFDVSTSDETMKMRVVSNNLAEGARIRFNCANLGHGSNIDKIPTKVNGVGSNACQTNKENDTNFEEFGYRRDYIENLYKEIFGSNKTLNTSVNIPVVASSFGYLVYVKDLDMYVFYPIITGFTCAGVDSFELVEAKKRGNEILLYEDYSHIIDINEDGSVDSEKLKFVYTFKNENGLYSFVSRKKVN